MQGLDGGMNLAASSGSTQAWLERGRGRSQISIQAAAVPRRQGAPKGAGEGCFLVLFTTQSSGMVTLDFWEALALEGSPIF